MIEGEKAAARAAGFARRKTAHAAGQGQAAELLADFLSDFKGKALSGYMAMRTEMDPMAAMMAHQGPVCVPVIVAKGQALKFREWTPGCAMVRGEFGADIPRDGAWIEPEVLIVPLIAFDDQGFRLGYGGGFYDRTLQALRARRAPLAVGFGFAAQEMPQVPIDETDQKLDVMVTETGVRRFI